MGVLMVLVGPGCGRSSLEPEILGSSGTASTCGPSNCPSGCCDSNGTCRVGSDTRACGSAGARCSDCVANGFDDCTDTRVCGRDDPACSATTCPNGCCSSENGRRRCLSGTEPAGCGRGGGQCANCTTEGRTCDASTRSCGSSRCTTDNCNGCCVGDQCLSGEVSGACGGNGSQCEACPTGQSCRAQTGGGGVCEGTAACGPANCNGCCDARGRCVSGRDTTACGREGRSCKACAIDQVCGADGQPNAGTCQTQATCGPATCPGCCVGNQCVVATTPQACGINGQACGTCGPNLVCNATTGLCVPPSNVCNALSCATCCVGDVCAVGTQNTACGVGGGLCTNCANQNPGRVCQSGVCQLPACGPTTCPNGCCNGNTCVVGTQDAACGGAGGAQCGNCTASGQVCQGRQCRDRCSAANCAGCCQGNNNCAVGIENDACGSSGAACGDCDATGSFCNGLVVPRRCNDQQATCPAPYGTCAPGIATPVTPPLQNVCTDAILTTLATACVSGPDSAACNAAFATVANACSACLGRFKVAFERRSGLWACAAASVPAACRRSTGCATSCADTSCDSCAPASEGQCTTLVNGAGGQCAAFFDAAGTCANGALRTGQPCSQFSYPTFGEWFRTVGDRFCGNGP